MKSRVVLMRSVINPMPQAKEEDDAAEEEEADDREKCKKLLRGTDQAKEAIKASMHFLSTRKSARK